MTPYQPHGVFFTAACNFVSYRADIGTLCIGLQLWWPLLACGVGHARARRASKRSRCALSLKCAPAARRRLLSRGNGLLYGCFQGPITSHTFCHACSALDSQRCNSIRRCQGSLPTRYPQFLATSVDSK